MADLALFNKTITDQRTQDYLTQVLGEKKSSFVSNLTALVSSNVSLQQCEPVSILYAGIKATALDLPLDPNLGFAYVLPYKDNKTGKTVATFQMGYKGFKQLAIRSGKYRFLNASDVREGEIKSRNRLTGSIEFQFIEDDAERLSKPIIGYFSYFETVNDFHSLFYMPIVEIKEHAKKYSKSYQYDLQKNSKTSKWSGDDTEFGKMCKKTVTKLNLSNNGILSVEMQDAIRVDQGVITDKGVSYIDNEPAKDQSEKATLLFGNALNNPDAEQADVVEEVETVEATEESFLEPTK